MSEYFRKREVANGIYLKAHFPYYMLLLFWLWTSVYAGQPTCSDLQTTYSVQNCCQGNQSVGLCGAGTQWDGQQCQIQTPAIAMTIQPFDRPDESIAVTMATGGAANGWHTCTCKDGSTYECQSNRGDGAACCGRSMPAICGEGNVDMDGYQFDTGSGWHTCTCEDGSTYECKSSHGDGAACCGRSMPAICGEDNIGSSPIGGHPVVIGGHAVFVPIHADGWHTCTCEDGSTYECKSKHGDGSACCDRSKPAICGTTSATTRPQLDIDDTAVFGLSSRVLDAKYTNIWHECTCDDGSTYKCQSNRGDGNACCGRSKAAVCGAQQPVWHNCTCGDGSTFQCKSSQGDGSACCDRSVPAICGQQCQASQCASWSCKQWCECYDSKFDIEYSTHQCGNYGTCDCTDSADDESGGHEIYAALGDIAKLRKQLHPVLLQSPTVYGDITSFPTPNLPCGGSNVNCGPIVPYIREANCCKAMTLACLACADRQTPDEYCLKHPQTQGCDALPLHMVDL